ncbi:MAG TPA: TonB-dependent receptor [Caulobacterales bacterium]|nr:TonB-dependent receptor [Caulobacterales bacterium]
MHKINLLAGVGIGALVFAPAIEAYAQQSSAVGSIGEVVVTATKMGVTNLQKTPLSVAVVGGDDLEKARVVTLRDLPSAVPALKVVQANANPVVYIRGIGGYPGNNEPDVGIYQDGVYLGRTSIATGSNFNDLERIEVVKGPQGTLFGRNTVGGAINFISKQPPKTFKFENTLNVGNFTLIDEAFSIGGPLTDRMQASLSVGLVKREGYLDNVVPGQPNGAAADRKNVRFQLRYELTDKITNLVRADYIYTDEDWATNETLLLKTNDPRVLSCTTAGVCTFSGYAAPLTNSAVGDLTKFANFQTPHLMEQSYGINDELTWEVNEHLTIKNLAAYRTDKSVNIRPGNNTEYATGITPGYYRTHTISDELNLEHSFGALSGVAGVYYFYDYERNTTRGITAYAPPVRTALSNGSSYQDTRFPTTSKAAFISETYHFTPELAITVGARYTAEHKELDTYNTSYVYNGDYYTGSFARTASGDYVNSAPSGGPDPRTLVVFPYVKGYGTAIPALERDSNAFTPKIGVEFQATPNAFLYASATKGFKSGGFNFTARNDFGAYFNPEKIKTYEIGAKTDWFDKRLRVNVAAFRNDWQDLQVNAGLVVPESVVTIQIAANAAQARLTGYEFDVTAKPLDGLTFTASATMLPEAKYLEFKTGQAGNIVKQLLIQAKDPRENALANTYDASGNRLPNTPKVSAVFSAQKDFDLANGDGLYIKGTTQYTSATYFDPSNHPLSRRAPFSIYNMQIGYTLAGGHWDMALWGNNITDKQYFSSLRMDTFAIGTPGAPRTYGLRLNYTY